jgi:hypothetical protein
MFKIGDSVFIGKKEGTKVKGTITSPAETANQKEETKHTSPDQTNHAHEIHTEELQKNEITLLAEPTKIHNLSISDLSPTSIPESAETVNTTLPAADTQPFPITTQESVARVSKPSFQAKQQPADTEDETPQHTAFISHIESDVRPLSPILEQSEVIQDNPHTFEQSTTELSSTFTVPAELKEESTQIKSEQLQPTPDLALLLQTHMKAREQIFDAIAIISQTIEKNDQKETLTISFPEHPVSIVKQLLIGAEATLIDMSGSVYIQKKDKDISHQKHTELYAIEENGKVWEITLTTHGKDIEITASSEALRLIQKRLERFLSTPVAQETPDSPAEEETYLSPIPPAWNTTDDTAILAYVWFLISQEMANNPIDLESYKSPIPVFAYS